MMRGLLNIAASLSLLLALATAGMWVRSKFVTEGWEFKPHPSGMQYAGSGYHRQRLVESANGNLVFAAYNVLVRPDDPPRAGGYRRGGEPLTPDLHARFPYLDSLPPGTVNSGIPGLVQWWIVPLWAHQRFVAVSWLVLTAVFTVLPGVRAWRVWRRWRHSRMPGFPAVARG